MLPAVGHDKHVGTVLDGRYRLVRLLGSGAVGAVYEAVDGGGRHLALKLLLERIKGKEDGRFAREALITSTVSHPNIASVLDSGVDAATQASYLVMDLLSGEDLGSVLDRVGPLPPAIAVRILLGACAGVAAAHAAGIVHRDIKPSNIFLHQPAPNECIAKVCDFGLAKQLFTSESMTESGNVLGSPAYMSPEQARSAKRVDHRSDVWSLAMTLYEMLSGVTAFHEQQTIYTLAIALATEDVPPLQDAAPWIAPGLATVIHGALLRDLGARCPDVPAFVEALWPFAEGSQQLDPALFLGLSAEERAVRAEHAVLPRAWLDVGYRRTSYAPPPHPDDPVVRLLGHSMGGNYPLLHVVAHGQTGAIYETLTVEAERLAVKVVLTDASRSKAEATQLVREARGLIAIVSDHVVKTIDAGVDLVQQAPFIVMELLEGQDLASILRTQGAIAVGHAARIFVEAGRGLGATHAAGVVHKNITPSSVFLHELPDGRLVTKLCNFGFGAHEDTDPPADLRSLALALYETVSGRLPWEGRASELPRLHEYAPGVSREFADVVHRAMRVGGPDRYATATDFALALEPFAEPDTSDQKNV